MEVWIPIIIITLIVAVVLIVYLVVSNNRNGLSTGTFQVTIVEPNRIRTAKASQTKVITDTSRLEALEELDFGTYIEERNKLNAENGDPPLTPEQQKIIYQKHGPWGGQKQSSDPPIYLPGR
jgi:hypothetical protein